MIFNKEWLSEKYPDVGAIPFLFFRGHQPVEDGGVGKSCFSQFWVAPFKVDGLIYPTAEHWTMAGKAKLFGDEVALKVILGANSPAAAKKEGRIVKNFVSEVWDKHKFEIVVAGNYHKFSQHEQMKEFLLATEDKVLVEASPRDRIWGIGMGSDNPAAGNPAKWKGENLLGFALMEVREKLR
jgi:ribA/ribD-fused uncharacterized protein